MKKIAAMAEAHYIMMAPHSGSLGPVAEYAALHSSPRSRTRLILERIEDDWDGREQTVVPHPKAVDGYLPVPDAPGLGVDIDEDFVALHPSRANVSVPATAESGSYAGARTASMSMCRRGGVGRSISGFRGSGTPRRSWRRSAPGFDEDPGAVRRQGLMKILAPFGARV